MRWELLERFLAQTCDEAERDEVLKWAAESVRHRKVLEELIKAFRTEGDAPSMRTEWERLRQRLKSEAETEE